MEEEKYKSSALGTVLCELWNAEKIIISINIITIMLQIMLLVVMLKKM